jgi:uncharacterized membrane protein
MSAVLANLAPVVFAGLIEGLGALFLGGIVLLFVLYVVNVVLGRVTIPADIKQLILAGIGLCAFILWIVLVYFAFVGGLGVIGGRPGV